MQNSQAQIYLPTWWCLNYKGLATVKIVFLLDYKNILSTAFRVYSYNPIKTKYFGKITMAYIVPVYSEASKLHIMACDADLGFGKQLHRQLWNTSPTVFCTTFDAVNRGTSLLVSYIVHGWEWFRRNTMRLQIDLSWVYSQVSLWFAMKQVLLQKL